MITVKSALAVAAGVILLDQLTKWLALEHLDSLIAVTSFFNLVLVWNTGVSFGMFRGLGGWGPWLLTGFAIVISVALVVWLMRETRPLTRLALGLVLGGALGNVVDRLRFGAVVDFLDFHAMGYHWPAFNVADSSIVVGVSLLIIEGMRPSREAGNEVRGHIR